MSRAGNVELEKLPGVGPRIVERLLSRFGSREAVLEALENGDVESVAEALGSYRRAVRLIRSYRAAAEGYTPGEVTATSDSTKLFETVLTLFQGLLLSKYSRERVALLEPRPGRLGLPRPLCPSSTLPQHTLPRSVLSALASISKPRKLGFPVRAELLVVTDRGVEQVREKLREKGVIGEVVAVEEYASMQPPRPLAVFYGDEPVASSGLGGIVAAVDELTPPVLAPRTVLEVVAGNQRLATAIVRLSSETPELLRLAARSTALTGISLDRLVEAARAVEEAGEMYRRKAFGDEYVKAARLLERFDGIVTDLEVWVNEEARRRLEAREYRLSAAQLLELLSKIEQGLVAVPSDIMEIFEEVVSEAEKRLARELSPVLGAAEDYVKGVIKLTPVLPLELDAATVSRLRGLLEERVRVLETRALIRLAERVWDSLSLVDAMFRVSVEADIVQACSRYRDMVGGGWVESLEPGKYGGVAVRGGREASLLAGGVTVEPVDYVVGCTRYQPEGTSCERIVFLTGANSGGKTTLLKLVGEAVLAAQAGLPPPAEHVELTPFDRVYYVAKPTGMLSAGALESVLRLLARIVAEARRHRVLVLVDEFEAVTEFHAAVRIVSTLVEELAETNAVAVIVSHLAAEILSTLPGELRGKIRVDGIEAEGLDENYNLVVKRTPRYNYLARSTPELVVRRLVHTTRRRSEREFYEKLLSALS